MSESQDSTLKHPASTPEVLAMLGLHKTDADVAAADAHASQPPAHLPVDLGASDHGHSGTTGRSSDAVEAELESLAQKAAAQPTYVKVIKTILPYVIVFAVGIFLYYFFFSTVNFSSIISTTPKASAPQETALQTLEKQDMAGYNTWINSFYYDVSDPKLVDPEADNSGNGLSNFQKYLLNLNPKSFDTMGLGMGDSQAISQGLNPLSGSPLTDAQKAIIDKYIDMEVVMNRLTLAHLQSQGSVAGAATNQNGQPLTQAGSPQNGTNPNYYQVQVPTPTPTQTQYQAPATGANTGGGLVQDQSVDVNTSVPGLLEIPQLKVSVPLMWTQDTNNFDNDLQVGVVHYPGTAVPGQIGTTYIAGHSSNYIWAKGNYNHVFTHLGDLANNASFQITVTSKSGQKVIYHYVVVKSQQYSPTDQAQFQNTGQSLVALSTCWPVGSTAKRLVVFGQLTQVEK